MKEIWKEICDGTDFKVVIITLLSIALILALSLIVARTFSSQEKAKLQQESSIAQLFLNPLQTNFTS